MNIKLTAVFQKVPEGYIGFVEELPVHQRFDGSDRSSTFGFQENSQQASDL